MKIIPHIITSIIKAENITTLDISKCFFDNSILYNQSSVEKKLWRFFNTANLMALLFFNESIKYIINNFKALKHNKLIVVMDHMFMKNYIV